MKLIKYFRPIIFAAVLTTAKANPTYTVVTGYGTFDLTTVNTSFAADSAVLEAMPWWGNVGLTYALSSTLNGQYGYDGSNLAVFAIGSAGNFAPAVDLNGNPVVNFGTAIAVNTNNPAIPYPYISDEDQGEVLPYVVLTSAVSAVPDTSSTLVMLSFALGCGAILRRRTARSIKRAGS